MSLREELDQFLAAHSGIEHLVYGDLSTGMVLYAGSVGARAQEDHDRLLERGMSMFNDASMGVDPSNGLEIVMVDNDHVLMFVRASQKSDEGLFFELAAAAGAFDIADAASATLAKFAED